MDVKNFKEGILDHYHLIAVINRKTHECDFVKRHKIFLNEPLHYNDATIFFNELLNHIHEKDFSILERRIGDGKLFNVKNMACLIHMKASNNSYLPYYAEFMDEGDFIYFTLRAADAHSARLAEALYGLEECCIKIITVDLSNDTFREIKVLDNEKPLFNGFSDWAQSVIETYIYDNDRKLLTEFLSIDHLSEISLNNKVESICYRRWHNNQWVIVIMKAIPTINFETNTPEIMLYISQIS